MNCMRMIVGATGAQVSSGKLSVVNNKLCYEKYDEMHWRAH